jgi:hypothetical protein
VYSGKVMAGLIAACRGGSLPADGSIVFLHTGGGPGLLSTEHSQWLLAGLAAIDRPTDRSDAAR